ncbi:MAG: BamA/TamA family outer membrane protein [Bacteroidota bacterium]|nr:BamA/TamA family outer membrane protein [Bacteroidota bacterium]
MILPGSATVQDTLGQRDLIGIGVHLFHIHPKGTPHVDGRRVYFSLLPLSTSVPGGGNALVTSTQAGFYLGPRKTTYLSNITFSPSINTRGQFNLPFHSNIGSANNAWNYQGDARFSIYPQYTWGLGASQPDDHKITIRYSYIRFYQNRLKRIKPYLFAGVGYDMDYYIHIHTDSDTANLHQFTGYAYGTTNHSNSFSSGISLNLLYDTRNNSINPLPGSFFNVIYRVSPQLLGSNTNWHSLYLDARKYIPLSDMGQNVLALWSYFWTTLGSYPPYLNLPSIGWDPNQRSGRGFYPGRFNGKSLYYAEAEYRRDITYDGLFGFVVFSELVTATEPVNGNFARVHTAAGTGLRIKFNKHSGSNLGIDFAFSKDYNTISINLGEAF